MTDHPAATAPPIPDGTFAWIQRDEPNAVRVPALRDGGRWVLGYYANGDIHVWEDHDIAHVDPIPTLTTAATTSQEKTA